MHPAEPDRFSRKHSSLTVLVARASNPGIPVQGRLPGTNVFHRLDQDPASETYTDLVILRFDAPCFLRTPMRCATRFRSI